MIGVPLLDDGVVQVTCVEPAWPVVAEAPPGAAGGLHGEVAEDGSEAGPVPMALVAATVKVQEPGARPVTVQEPAVAPAVQVAPPGDAVRPQGICCALPRNTL